MESEYVGKQTFIVVSSKNSPMAKARELKDLSEASWILSPETCGTRSQVEAALSRQRLPFTVSVETEGKDLQLSLVANNVGLGVVPMQVYLTSVLRKQLAVLRLKDFVPAQHLWIIRARNINSHMKIMDALKTSLALALRI